MPNAARVAQKKLERQLLRVIRLKTPCDGAAERVWAVWQQFSRRRDPGPAACKLAMWVCVLRGWRGRLQEAYAPFRRDPCPSAHSVYMNAVGRDPTSCPAPQRASVLRRLYAEADAMGLLPDVRVALAALRGLRLCGMQADVRRMWAADRSFVTSPMLWKEYAFGARSGAEAWQILCSMPAAPTPLAYANSILGVASAAWVRPPSAADTAAVLRILSRARAAGAMTDLVWAAAVRYAATAGGVAGAVRVWRKAAAAGCGEAALAAALRAAVNCRQRWTDRCVAAAAEVLRQVERRPEHSHRARQLSVALKHASTPDRLPVMRCSGYNSARLSTSFRPGCALEPAEWRPPATFGGGGGVPSVRSAGDSARRAWEPAVLGAASALRPTSSPAAPEQPQPALRPTSSPAAPEQPQPALRPTSSPAAPEQPQPALRPTSSPGPAPLRRTSSVTPERRKRAAARRREAAGWAVGAGAVR